jgi:hypothetical protein
MKKKVNKKAKVKKQAKVKVKRKYHNKKIEIDGIIFDSLLEGGYYQFLKKEKLDGKIKDFSLQPSFLLINGYMKYGKKIRKMEYIADFKVIHNDNTEEILDTKGVLTDVFKIKKKLLLSLYDIDFYIVKLVNGTYIKIR